MRSSIYFILFFFCALSSCQSEVRSKKKIPSASAPIVEAKTDLQNVSETAQSEVEKSEVKEVKAKSVSMAQNPKQVKKQVQAPKQDLPVKTAKPILMFSRVNHKWKDSITSGDIINHTFEFQNGGNADLVIQSVNATCGCTRPSYPFIPLAAGEKGEIKMQYNSLGKTGWQRPTLTVNSNEAAGIKRVYLDVYVKPKPKKKKKANKQDTLKSKKEKVDSLKE